MTAPAQHPPAPPADVPTTGERWAFRVFLVLFFLTLIVGLLHYLFSKLN